MKDEEIIERLRDGDKQAYKELFIRYYSPLCEFASHYVQDNEAEELVENLMLYLWEAHEYLAALMLHAYKLAVHLPPHTSDSAPINPGCGSPL